MAAARRDRVADHRPWRFAVRRVAARVAGSLWFAPGLAAIVAVALAKLLPLLDASLWSSGKAAEAWYLFPGQPESARDLLSTIAASMMTFTALVFSVTILVLQLASQQFSPRVLRTFLEERSPRIALASFIGTFLYAMALLPEVRQEHADAPAFVPRLSIFLAFALVVASVGVFISYIHRMANAIRVVHIIARVAADARDAIDVLYPEDVGNEPEEPATRPRHRPTQVVCADDPPGVVEAIDEGALLRDARRHDAVIAVVPYLGDFVARGMPLLEVWSGEPLDEAALRRAVVLGSERTAHQDPAFGFRQLVDIAERALSPGVNDPTTAVQALDQLHDLLRRLTTRRFPSDGRLDDDGRLRLILPRPGYDAYVHLAFDEIRRSGAGQVQIERRLRAVLEDLLRLAPTRRRPTLLEQLGLLDRAVERSAEDPVDRDRARVPSAQGHGAAGGEATPPS